VNIRSDAEWSALIQRARNAVEQLNIECGKHFIFPKG